MVYCDHPDRVVLKLKSVAGVTNNTSRLQNYSRPDHHTINQIITMNDIWFFSITYILRNSQNLIYNRLNSPKEKKSTVTFTCM